MLAAPLKLLGGGGPVSLPTPMSQAYAKPLLFSVRDRALVEAHTAQNSFFQFIRGIVLSCMGLIGTNPRPLLRYVTTS